MTATIHIGFLARDFLKWRGGLWFSQHLLRGLAALPPAEVAITVLVPTDRSLAIRTRYLAGALKRAIRRPSQIRRIFFGGPSPEARLAAEGIEQIAAIVPRIVAFDGSDADLIRRSTASGVQVILPVMTPLRRSTIPWVGYLYDCQHKHFPQFFPAREIARRDRDFATMLERATVVFANAEAVLNDLRRYFPTARSELFSLPFAPLIREDELREAVDGAAAASQRVAGGAPYFIVCNQFWVHKDHATAFRAFARFAADPVRSHWRLVCTGLTEDYRAPDHFARLKILVDELGLADRVIFTGYVDRAEQQPLLRGAAALLQPTLFEGGPGGGAAVEAVALGVPCVLSDIAVNRELVDPLASFFAVGDPESLAAAMEAVASSPPARASASELIENGRRSAERLGRSLCTLAERALVPRPLTPPCPPSTRQALGPRTDA